MSVMRAWARATGVGFAALVAGGCAGMGGYDAEVSAGSRLEVHERLPISDYSGRVYVQGGEILRQNTVDIYRPFCSFGLRGRGDEEGPGEIRPGRFEVIRDSRHWYRAGYAPARDVLVASAGIRGLAAIEEDRSVDRYYLYTELEIRSQQQPQVDNLRCEYFGRTIDKIFERYPTPEQINEALGGIATLRGPGA